MHYIQLITFLKHTLPHIAFRHSKSSLLRALFICLMSDFFHAFALERCRVNMRLPFIPPGPIIHGLFYCLIRDHWNVNHTYLQNVPSHEKHIIFGCHWFKVEWYLSKQLVSASGESLLISFSRLVFIRSSCIFSYATVPRNNQTDKNT